MKLLFDTNVIYSLYYINDSNHEKAKEMFHRFGKSSTYYIPLIVYAELLIGVKESLHIETFVKLINRNLEIHTLDDVRFVEGLDFSVRSSLKANDCLVIAQCSRLGAKLVTFDKKLSKLAKSKDLLFVD